MLLLVSFVLLFVLSLFLRANTHTHTSFLLSYLRLSYELGQTPGDGEGQGNLVCCSPWGCKGSGMTGRLNNSNTMYITAFSVQFSSVAQSCPTLCDPMNCSTPGLPVHHQLPELTQTHVHRVGDAIQPSHPLSSPSPAPNPSQHQSFFQ